MNLQRPNSGEATHTANRSRDVVPCSGICTICMDGCQGNCEIFKSSFRGREVIYPGPFGEMTAGGNKDYPIDYSHLNIHGYALGAEYLHDRVAAAGFSKGNGAVILFGFTPQYRAQSRNTMKMLFNTILGAGNPLGASRLLRERP